MSEPIDQEITVFASKIFITLSVSVVLIACILIATIIASLLQPALILNHAVLIGWFLSPFFVMYALFFSRIPFKTTYKDSCLITYGYFGKRQIELRRINSIKRTTNTRAVTLIMIFSCLKLKTDKGTVLIHLLSVPIKERLRIWNVIEPSINRPDLKKPDEYEKLLDNWQVDQTRT